MINVYNPMHNMYENDEISAYLLGGGTIKRREKRLTKIIDKDGSTRTIWKFVLIHLGCKNGIPTVVQLKIEDI